MMAKILIADDNRDVIETLADILTYLNYEHEVTFTTSMAELLLLLDNTNFDICVTDLLFVGEGAADIYGLHKRFGRRTKFIVISAYTKQLDQKYLQEQGIPVLQKPFSAKQLINAIEKALNERPH